MNTLFSKSLLFLILALPVFAETPEHLHRQAAELRRQETVFRARAAEEKAEWERRSLITTSLYAKYPQPADSSRYRYEYYAGKANEAARHAAEIEAREGEQQK